MGSTGLKKKRFSRRGAESAEMGSTTKGAKITKIGGKSGSPGRFALPA